MLRPLYLFAGFVAWTSAVSAATSSLSEAPSAYVRAHADSPVHWMSWGEPAFARARAEQKPVYVVVGSFTQELARAMREQNFAREENAALLNENFVCVVVDRDEHPDLAAFYQAYISTVKQVQGWPLNLWLTPELKPFEGTAYLPPSDEWGKEGFPNAIKRILSAWQTDPEAQRAKAEDGLAALAAAAPLAAPAIDADALNKLLAESSAGWLATYDAAGAGFGEAPRRLEPELLRFLLQTDEAGRSAAVQVLRALATSPMRDPLDGGFFRSAGDTAWRQPSLQKMLGDQARIALACAEAARLGGAPELKDAADGALSFALSLGTTPQGFSAAEDGTPETIVPSFFWTVADVQSVLGAKDSASILAALDMSEVGNLPPDSYLGVDSTGKNLARFATLAVEKPLADQLGGALKKLRAERVRRAAPLRDSLATSGAHGLLLSALVCCGDSSSRSEAAQLAAFLREKCILPDGRLRSAPGFATAAGPRDYAQVIDGLLAFATAAKNEQAHEVALALLAKVDALFWDAAAGRYFANAVSLAPGIGARVVAPAPDAGEFASTESAMLLALSTHNLGDPGKRAALAATIAAEIAESASPARGDQLLALQAYLGARR